MNELKVFNNDNLGQVRVIDMTGISTKFKKAFIEITKTELKITLPDFQGTNHIITISI